MQPNSVDGVIARIMFHRPSKFNPSGVPYLIARLHNGIVVKGECRNPVVGELARFFGSFQPQKGRDEHAFEFVAFEYLVDRSVAGIEQYLAAHVRGVGRARASLLVEHFGLDTLDVLRSTPERAAEVPGLTPAIADAIRQHFASEIRFDPAAYAKLIDLFADHRIPKKVVYKLLDAWGSSAPEAVKANPYQLLVFHRLGWQTVDSLAIAKLEYDPLGTARHAAAIVEALDQLASEGHTYGTKAEVAALAHHLLNGWPVDAAWDAVQETGKVVQNVDSHGEELWALAKLDHAEREVARLLAVLTTYARPLPFTLATDGLEGQQVDAVRMLEEHGVCVLSGAPGTGKSWSTTHAVSQLLKNGFGSIMFMAPTGKAAKRAAELLAHHLPGVKIPCSTIHKALGPAPSEDEPGVPKGDSKVGRGRDEFSFQHNEANPLDVSLAIVDEMSMCDVSLAAAVLSAIPKRARLLIVGDHNQLPSVGPGSVLRDMLEADVPSTILTEIRRNSGRIVRACHAIKDGKVPRPADGVDFAAGDNWVHLEMTHPAEIAGEIARRFEAVMANPASQFDPLWGMQVISPQIDKPAHICCKDLNRMLSPILNPSRPAAANGIDGSIGGGLGDSRATQDEGDGPAPAFRIGDKVVRTKNGLCDEMTECGGGSANGKATARPDWRWQGKDWSFAETAIVNGDLGQVLDIVEGDPTWWVVVRFRDPDRLCRLPFGDSHLIQAYALTVHKMQGSSAPYVILPVHNSFFWDARKNIGIWSRELVYTAFSRAETLLVTIGEFSAIAKAVGRKTVNRRRTRLAERLRAAGVSEVRSYPATHAPAARASLLGGQEAANGPDDSVSSVDSADSLLQEV